MPPPVLLTQIDVDATAPANLREGWWWRRQLRGLRAKGGTSCVKRVRAAAAAERMKSSGRRRWCGEREGHREG
jgi:hypothetical protein